MTNIINIEDYQDQDSGYVITDAKPKALVTGIYHKGLSAVEIDGEACVGHKADDGIDYPVFMSIDDMNRFCMMWLCIFDPSAISDDKKE